MCRTLYPGTTILKIEIKYISDELNKYREWYRSGIIKTKLCRVKDKRNGLCQKWSDKGILLSEQNYKNGIKHGTYKTYRANGKIRYNYVYDNGQIIVSELWNKRGKLIRAMYEI